MHFCKFISSQDMAFYDEFVYITIFTVGCHGNRPTAVKLPVFKHSPQNIKTGCIITISKSFCFLENRHRMRIYRIMNHIGMNNVVHVALALCRKYVDIN